MSNSSMPVGDSHITVVLNKEFIVKLILSLKMDVSSNFLNLNLLIYSFPATFFVYCVGVWESVIHSLNVNKKGFL